MMIFKTQTDFAPDLFGYTPQRFALVDFSTPIRFEEIGIFYGKLFSIQGDIIEGIFDWPSYISIMVGAIAFNVTIYVALKRENLMASLTFVKTSTYLVGHIFGQGFPYSGSRTSTQSILQLFFITYTLLRLMYTSILITKLTATDDLFSINSLEELAREKTEMRILIVRNSYVADGIKHIKTFNDMADRIEYFAYPTENHLDFYQGLMEKIVRRTHVLIEAPININRYRKTVPEEVRCKFLAKNFGYSNEKIFVLPSGWPIRKNFSLAGIF